MIRPLAAALPLMLLAAPALAGGWTVNAEASALNVFSLKNGDVAEEHAFTGLSGSVSAEGEARVEIALGSIATGIEIRDARMREMLFRVAEHPLAEVRAQVDPAAFEALAVGEAAPVEAVLAVEANGAGADYPASLLVTRLGEDRVAVSSAHPVVLRAEDFGYGPGIEALREVAGLEAIAPSVPVVFLLVLER